MLGFALRLQMSRTDHYHTVNAPKATRLVPAVSAIVRSDADRIVLHRRRDNGFWSLPGGGIEPGETIVGAVLREVLEETGYSVAVERLIGIYSDPCHVIEYSNGEVRQQFSICFACRIVGGTIIVGEESFEVRPFSRSEVDNLEIHPANRQRIDDYWLGSDLPVIR